ncbi:MAG: transcription antitermination factor NusB [Saprospiraceae bacterium]
MLSRRNIRIKVMQMLYAGGRDKSLDYKTVLQRYHFSINKSYELYLFNLLVFLRVAKYAQVDAAQRKSKHLPTEEDLIFTAKLCDNPYLQSLLENEPLFKVFKSHKLIAKIDNDFIRELYLEFSKSEVYKTFIQNQSPDQTDYKVVFLALYKKLSSSEYFNEEMEAKYSCWIDDKSLIVGTIKKTIKALPLEDSFYEQYIPTEETVKDFGETLLLSVFHDDDELLEHIEPTLKNWDVDRVAIIDMILLKMALCELLNFPTIPTKVTLNEFVEISKLYSTDKSKDFINGILDRLMKKLISSGLISKEGRGLVE